MDDVLDTEDLLQRLPKNGFTMSFCSRRNSGKSTLIGEIVQQLLKAKMVDMVIVMTGSAGMENGDYSFLPPELVMPFNEGLLIRMWEKQKTLKKAEKQHILLVIDDALTTPEAINNPIINSIFSLGRHNLFSAIVSSQHTTSLLNPIIRGNSDIIGFSKLSRGNLEKLHEATSHISKKDFIRICESLGGHDWNFVVIDNYKQTSDPSEYITVVRGNPKLKIRTPSAKDEMGQLN
jgi:hypothetical protein